MRIASLIAGAALGLGLTLALTPTASAFCGFYVAKADADLFNEASKVVMARDGDRTVITMVNDFEGDVSDFAMVVPTPAILERGQINIAENALIEHLDAYTAPRLVEYYDDDPCAPQILMRMAPSADMAMAGAAPEDARAQELGVTIEAQYTVGEYDILILSATESDGLQTWLDENGYRTPEKARQVLGSYIAQGMKFFVAKVNLEEQARTGLETLRPLQIAFESEKFMLPIRLGTVNARGAQELLLFTLTRTGRVEAQNYRTARIPSNVDIPLFVQKEFGDFYKAMFREAATRNPRTLMTEYAWDMSWCDPCAADALSNAQLRQLGAYWLAEDGARAPRRGGAQAVDVFVTRLHVRYDAESFPEDLRLMETGDRENFQGRYVTRHPFRGEASCSAGDDYRRQLGERYRREAETLANLTGWPIDEIRAKMAANGQDLDALPEPQRWWERMWEN